MHHQSRRSRPLALALGASAVLCILINPKLVRLFAVPGRATYAAAPQGQGAAAPAGRRRTSGGATYTVAPEGDDGDDGSESHPWKTLQHAAALAQPGDTVNVRPGSYAGFAMGWDGPQGGTVDRPIRFRGQAGAAITARNPRTPDGIILEGASNIVIEGFTVTNDGSIRRAGIRSVRNKGVVLEGNRIEGMGTWGIFTSFSQGVRIENNTVTGSVKEHGVYVSNSTDRPVIRRNVIAQNNVCGIHLNGDASQGGTGVITGALVENNVIHRNGKKGGSGINADGVQYSVFQNNLLYENHSSGISLYRIDGGAPSRYNLVVNNTVVVAADGRWALNIQNGSTGNTAYNNILYSYHPSHGSIRISADSLPGFICDHNAVVSRFTTDDDGVLDLAQWQERTGRDQHSMTAKPEQLFRDAKGGDFSLAPGSPAIDAGTPHRAPSSDGLGNRRPWGDGPDIGAHEAQEKRPTAGPPASARPVPQRGAPLRFPEPVKPTAGNSSPGVPNPPPMPPTPAPAAGPDQPKDSSPNLIPSRPLRQPRRLDKNVFAGQFMACLVALALISLAAFGMVWLRHHRRGVAVGFARPPPAKARPKRAPIS